MLPPGPPPVQFSRPDDGLVTWAEIADWYPRIRRDLELALSPEIRGWWTADEAWRDGGRFVETRTMSEAEGRYLRTGDR